MRPYDYRKHKIKWHNEPMHRLRLVSFVAERFWNLAFALRLGMEALTPARVRSVSLSDIEVDGVRKCDEVNIEVPEKDAALAFRIACGVVDFVEHIGFRILNAVVPDTRSDGKTSEHDLVGERKGMGGQSSIEVKCKTIQKVERLYDTFRFQMREDALKLWKADKFCERVVVLVEFDAKQSLDVGWRTLRCESYNGVDWKALRGWGGPAAQPPVPGPTANRSSTATRGVKRPRGSNNMSSLAGDSMWVSIAGAKYTT